jgi:hypothetical protein
MNASWTRDELLQRIFDAARRLNDVAIFVRLHFPYSNESGCPCKLTAAILNIYETRHVQSVFQYIKTNNKYFPSQATFRTLIYL